MIKAVIKDGMFRTTECKCWKAPDVIEQLQADRECGGKHP
jgi:hypothetical protein